MHYTIPNIETSLDLEENLKNIEKVIDDLNQRRDKGLDKELEEKLKKQLLISQVYHSNAIEGNKLSLRETQLILEGMVINERPLKDELEAKSLANATEYLYRLIDGREPITKRTLLELHGLILEKVPGIQAGKFRQEDVKIKNAEHVPINWGDVDNEIDELFKWMNRNSHKYHPLIMGSIIHHWLTWIHPFSDGNGRVSRMFLNFYLLQKGYPEIVIQISDRDRYYNSLIKADKKNDITNLLELLSDKVRQTISIYEEFINESDRQEAWKEKYKELSIIHYEKAKETYSYQYDVWKNQIGVFKALLAENIREISEFLPNLNFSIKEYDILSFSQYLDILEDRKISNTWYIYLYVYDKVQKNATIFIFYFNRFKYSTKFSVMGVNMVDKKTGKAKRIVSKPQIKLYVSTRINQKSQDLKQEIDLVNIGTWGDQLSFGVKNRSRNKNKRGISAKIITIKENPGKVIRKFIDQTLKYYFKIDIKN